MVSTTRINMHNKMNWKNLGWKWWWKQSLKTLKFQWNRFNWQSRGHGFEPRMLHHNENETPPGVSFSLLCRNNTGREPEGRERKMRGSGGASNSERVKPPEGGGADRQTCQRQGCKAPYAPPLKILEISIVSRIFLFDGNP